MKGIVERIRPYVSGKGAFLTINGKEYMFFGPISVRIDEHVEFQEGGITKDGKHTIKEIHHEQAQRQGGNLIGTSHLSKPLNPPAAQSNDIITWLSCLKSACIYNSKCQCDKKTLVEYADYFYEASKRIKEASR